MINMSIAVHISKELLDKDDILTGRISLFLRNYITKHTLPVQYYGREYPHLNFLKNEGKTTPKYEIIDGLKHVPIEVALIDTINDFLDNNRGLQEFDELIDEFDIGGNLETIIEEVNDKHKLINILKGWGVIE